MYKVSRIKKTTTMKKIYFLLSLQLVTGLLFAQLSGNYTIGGTSPNYNNIQTAINALMSNGVNGPTTFSIRDGVYTGQLNFGIIPGVSSANRVTFQSENQDSSLVEINYAAAGFSDNWVVGFDSTEYVTLKWLSLKGTGATQYATVVQFKDQCHYTHVENCYLESTLATSAILLYSPQGAFNEHVHIKNNYLFQGGTAINMRNDGGSALPNGQGVIVDNNDFVDNRSIAITMINHDYFEVTKNRITSPSQHNPLYFDAFYFSNGKKGGVIANNKIIVTGREGITLKNMKNTSTTVGKMYNNFISINGSATYASGITLKGQFTSSWTKYWNVYHNTVIIDNPTYGTAFNISYSEANNVYNNIFYNVNIGVAVRNNTASNLVNNTIDYNVLFTGDTVIGVWDNVNYLDLTSFQSASSTNPNSIAVNPNFGSLTDFHLCNTIIDGAGTTTFSSTLDLDGDVRDVSTPDIGADEFNATIDISTAVVGNTISANQTGVTYQWIDCGTTLPIAGEINQDYTPTVNGDYAVIITSGVCVDTSTCVNMVLTSINSAQENSIVKLYPNPASNNITLSFNETNNLEITVLDITGTEVYKAKSVSGNKHQIALKGFTQGLYFVKLKSNNQLKVIKFIKQ